MLKRLHLQDQASGPQEFVPISDEELLGEAFRWHLLGRKVAIATVVDVAGSASRPIGGILIVDHSGVFLGSVSAGCVEGEVITTALDVIETSEPCLLEFGASESAWQAGIPCGKIRVYVEPLIDELPGS